MTSYAVVTPSRGLVHSRTIEAVLANVAAAAGHDYRGWYLTHDLPIPRCDERAAELGLASGADALWWVEEDVVPPPGALAASLALLGPGVGAVAVDYPVGAAADAWGCIVRDPAGEVLWCGLGCTLVDRAAFERLPRPWFRTDWRWVRRGAGWEAVAVTAPDARRFGQQDIYFCHELRRAGLRVVEVPAMLAGHALVERYGDRGTNVGYHTVSVRTAVDREYPGPAS